MRVDKFLKVSRIIKRRTVANEACDKGRIAINGKIVKASAQVNVGDIMEITIGDDCPLRDMLTVAYALFEFAASLKTVY